MSAIPRAATPRNGKTNTIGASETVSVARLLRVALISLKHKEGDAAFNLDRHALWLERAVKAGARFVGFPEFALTGWVKDRRLALSLKSAPVRQIERLARKRRVFIATCFVEKRGARLHNTCLLAGPAGRLGVMRKVNLVAGESPDCTPGREFPVFKVAGCTMGVTTCADATHFEMMNLLSLRGAELIFAPHANVLKPYGNHAAGWRKWRMERWPLFARDACVHILGCNNAGLFEKPEPTEAPTKYCGGAMVIDFKGNVVARDDAGKSKRECMIVADLDIAALRKARRTSESLNEFRPSIVYNRKDGWEFGRRTE